jgi:hypothetical protein
MLTASERAVVTVRGAVALLAAASFLFMGAGCATPAACVGGIGVCKDKPLPQRYAIIDPSGSQAHLAVRQVAEVRAIVSHGPAEITIVRLGERPSTSSIVTRVKLPKVDQSDPNALAERTALLRKLDHVVKGELARRTRSSDQFGALELVHDDASQRGVKPGFRVFVLGDSEPCVPGVCWTHAVPAPATAIKQVQSAYSTLIFAGERVTFVVGGDKAAGRKSPAYFARLKAADGAVCKWARALTCKPVTEIAEATS